MIKTIILPAAKERNWLVRESWGVVTTYCEIIQCGINVKGTSAWIHDIGDGRIPATWVVSKYPISALSWKGDDSIVYPFLNSGEGTPTASCH